MKRAIVVLVVVGAVGYFGYTRMGAARYGFSAETPLGTFAALDAQLIDMGLVKAEFRGTPDRDVRGTARMYRYTNRENEYEYVTLLLDGSEAVQGVLSTYWLGDFGSRSPVRGFGLTYWRQLGGEPEPEFREIDRTRNATLTEATLPAGDVDGWWRVWREEGQREVRIYLHR